MQSPKYLHFVKEKYADKIDWYILSQHPAAIHLLERYPEKNTLVLAITQSKCDSLLERFPDKINWHMLSQNPNAIHLLEKNLYEIDWYELSANPNAIPLLKQNPDKIYWGMLSENPNIMEIICDLDYETMKKTMQPFAEEIAAYVFHPVRMNKIANQYDIPFDELITDIY